MSLAPLPAHRLRVLVVDPDADTRARYERSFVKLGFDVALAADGREALTKALMYPPRLVVMELRLPLIDAFALCEILRRDRATARTRLLIVTGETRPVALERIRRLGADDVLLKPVDVDVLAKRVGALVAASGDSTPQANVVLPQSRSVPRDAELPVPSVERRRTARAAARRELTMAPAMAPPSLNCPSCDCPLTYQFSHTGGVSERHPEQWDYLSCATCGAFQYRQRTRKLRRLDEREDQWFQRQRSSGRR